MLTSTQLKQITTEARPVIERQLEDAERLAGLRDVVAAAGGDWGQLKALIKAQIKDEQDETGDGKHVRKILDKADYALGYADMLGLGNLNENNNSSDDDDEEITSDASKSGALSAKTAAEEITPPQTSPDQSNMQTLHNAHDPIQPESEPATQSTAARKDVQTPARHGTQMPESRAPVSAPTVDASQATAGTQVPPVDTHSETHLGEPGLSPAGGITPAMEEGGTTASSIVAFADRVKARRPYCQPEEGKTCASPGGDKHCHRCSKLKEAAERETGIAVEVRGSIGQ